MRLRALVRAASAVAAICAITLAGAADVERSDLEPSDDNRPVVTLRSDGESRRLSRADIERVGLYDTELEHFEGPEGRFTGVRLKAFLDAHDIGTDHRLRLIAADDYTVFLEPAELAAKRYLLATRLDGEPLPRDAFGPLMLLVPEDAEAVLDGDPSMTQWIWGIVEIQAL